ncbi:uncharacterized protein LOC116254835 [Nymphaea colorata]|uniref:uncharacterized protein LOC116254835 n=1 Tax=Nymphaea colorata TaxID=210225 RepID=UPI00129EA8D3|nr:uncharacterized protein LOC116254835 [Nymphaea colorata]
MATVGSLSMPLFRPDFGYSDQYPSYSSYSYYSCPYFEKRQAFLRSYRFCRKRGTVERVKLSFARAKKVVWSKLRSARRIRRVLWLRLRLALSCRRRFHRLPRRSYYYPLFSYWT